MPILDKIPIEAAAKLGREFKLDRVLLIATSRESDKTYTVSWGKTKEDCGFAAMDIQKLRAVLEAQPTSYEQAIEVVKKVQPRDVRVNDQHRIIDGLLKVVADLDPGWNSITTPDIVVEAAAMMSGVKKKGK